MKKFGKRVLYGALVLMAVFSGSGAWFLHSERFQEWARVRIAAELEKATGLSCSIQRSEVSALRGSFRLGDLTLQSAKSDTSPVHVTIDEVSGSFHLLSLIRLKPQLAQLNIVRPRASLTSGQETSDWDPEAFIRRYRMSLEVAVGEIHLSDGWLQLNNRRVPFDLSLKQFVCEVAYQRQPASYRVHLAYENAQLDWAGRPVTYDLDVRASVFLEGVDIQSIGVRYNKTHLSGEGWIRDWRDPVALFHAAGTVSAVDLSIFDRHLDDASGNIGVLANFRLDASGFRSTARFTCPSGTYRGVSVKNLAGVMDLEKGILALRYIEGRVGQGSFQAEAVLHLLSSDRDPNRFRIDIERASLKDAANIIDQPPIAYENTVGGNVQLTWKKGSEDLDLTCNLVLGDPPAGSKGRTTDLRGNLSFRHFRGVWSIANASLQSPDTEITAIKSSGAAFHLQVRTKRTAEIFGILRGFSSSLREALAAHPDLMDLVGSYELSGDVLVNPPTGMAYQGSLQIGNGRWRTYSLDNLSASAYWNGRELDLRSLSARSAAASIQGRFHLALPEDADEPPAIDFQGSLQNLSFGRLAELGIDTGQEISGILSGSGSVSGSRESWRGDGRIMIEKGSYRGQTFDLLQTRAELKDGVLRISDCSIIQGPARLELSGQIGVERREMDLNVKLVRLSLGTLPPIRENRLQIEGLVSAAGKIQGTADNPVFSGRLQLEGLRYASWDLGGGNGTVELANKVLRGNAVVRSGLGACNFQATLSTEPGYAGSARLDLTDWNLQKLIAQEVPPYLRDMSTAVQARVNIKGRFSEPGSLLYDGEVDGARLKLHDYELSNSGKIRFRVAEGKLMVEEAIIVGEGTRLSLGGAIPVNGSPDLDLHLDGSLNLKLLGQLEKRLQVTGTADVNVRATGTSGNPQIIGQASINNARVEYGDLPFTASGLQGRIVFSRNLVRFENLRGSIASGNIEVSGAVEYQNSRMRGINVQFSARKVRVQYPRDFRSTVDADLNLRGGPDSQVLAGEIRVTRAEYLKDLNLLEQLASRSPGAGGPLTSDPFLIGLRLNVGLVSADGLYIDNELTKLRGGMRLTLRGTPAYPSLTGRIESNEGSIFFRGNRFDIIQASADFVDRNRINPVVEVRAEADVRSYRLRLDVNGDLDHLRFNVTSDPPMSTVDILTLLTTGKSREPGDENSRRQAEITGLSAASILSESLTGVLGKRVQRIFGLQSFRVDPFLAGVENDPTARVTISERLSKDLNVTFSRNLTKNEEQIVIVEYEVSKNLSIVATRNENGEFGLDFRFRKRFR